MHNDYLFFETSKKENHDKLKININKDKHICFNSKSKEIGFREIKRIRNFLNKVFSNNIYSKFPIDVNLGHIVFEDKLSIVLLETICYYFIREYNCSLRVTYCCSSNILTEGIKYSPLQMLCVSNKQNNDEYKKKSSWDIKGEHFRRLLRASDNENKMLTSNIMQDIDSFLKYFSIMKDHRDSISEVVAELIDNALEHTNSDCLIDLDVTHDYIKGNDKTIQTDETYRGINIVIINFSQRLIGEQLKQKISKNKELPHRYKLIINAYKNHSKYWNDNYCEDDFFIVSSFQHKISGRDDPSVTGGTGLTKLLKNIEEKSEAYNCYVLSGSRVFYFDHNFINYDIDNWIGFNQQNDYINYPPDSECLYNSDLFFPGTAYNLNFVIKREG